MDSTHYHYSHNFDGEIFVEFYKNNRQEMWKYKHTQDVRGVENLLSRMKGHVPNLEHWELVSVV